MVSDITFPDMDLDYTDLGGLISWTPPNDTSEVTEYFIYLADSPLPKLSFDEAGNYTLSGRSLLGNTRLGTNELFIPAETPRSGFTYLLVYSGSMLAEQACCACHS